MLERESLNTLRAAALRRISHAMPVALIALVTMTALIAAHRVPAAEVQRIVVDLVSACAAFGVAYTLLSASLVGRFLARPRAAPVAFPPVTLMKPLHGDEWRLVEHLASFLEQDYPGPIQYVFGVQDAEDPALHAIAELRVRYPSADIATVVDARLYGPNRKISNLVNMLEQARHDLLCFADSDVRVGRDYLGIVVGTLQLPGVGLVTSAYRGVSAPGFWPRASAASTNYAFFPGVVIGLATGLARPCFGQTIAIDRATLNRIGGLGHYVHHLAEDHAIGEAVRATGALVAIPPLLVEHACVEASSRIYFTHESRWSRTIRAADPLGHLGAALMHPLPFALLAVLASGGSEHAWLLAGAALLARWMLKWRVDRVFGQPFSDWACLPLYDLMQFLIYVASFGLSDVVWRGRRFRVDPGGRLTPRLDE
nr:bacteriohopanetetrol glucosamine biosynthesis glycosyltransferase HpnI [Burkholderia gladioli]